MIKQLLLLSGRLSGGVQSPRPEAKTFSNGCDEVRLTNQI